MAERRAVNSSQLDSELRERLWQAALLLAERVSTPRIGFQQAFDNLLKEVNDTRLPGSFLQAVVVASRANDHRRLLDPSQDRTAFALAFSAIVDAEALCNVALALSVRGVFDQFGATPIELAKNQIKLQGDLFKILKRKRSSAKSLSVRAAQEGVARAEAITDADGTWIDPGRLSPAIMLACRRVCRISAIDKDGETKKGTGFLVGPSAVMTNWHVIGDLYEIYGEGPLEANKLKFHFDSLRSVGDAENTIVEARLQDWLLVGSPIGPLSPAGYEQQLGWWMDRNTRLSWLGQLNDTLDFAVIALASAPGESRGWYDLSSVATFDTSGSCQVFHHPAGQGLSYSAGSIKFPPPPKIGNRLFHTASTVRGSSGGLLVNSLGLPVGLHHAGYGPENPGAGGEPSRVPDQVINAAIPLTAVAKKIGPEMLKSIATSTRLAAPQGLIDGRHPLFGRTDLLAALEELSSEHQTGPRKQLLWIKPPEDSKVKRPGKSFSVQVMKSLLPGNIYIELTADMVKMDGWSMAALLLDRIAAGRTGSLPKTADAGTTEAAYFEHHLIAKLFEEIRTAAPGLQIWIVLDELDTISLPDTPGRRFLDMLYTRMPGCPQLRLVLIGLKTTLPSIPSELQRPHLIEIGDVSRLFQDWLSHSGERNVAIDPKVKKFLGKAMESYAGVEQPMQRLADFARDHLVTPLSEFVRAGVNG
jgi:hypothetical protein